MDTITHGLAGYAVAKTGLARDTGRWGVIAGVAASLFPDADGLLASFYGTEFTLKYHRGLTNSILLVVPISLLFAWLFVKISGKKRFQTFFLIWVVEILVHTFLDLITSFGTMILSPLSSYRFALDWVFIIDLFLTGIFLIFSIVIMIWRSRSKTLARVSVALAAAYILMCAGNHVWALSLAKGYAHEHKLKTEKIASLPQPLSPFHWANYIVTDNTIYLGFVNLIGVRERATSPEANLFSQLWNRYQPIQALSYKPRERFDDSPWVKRALNLDSVTTFFWFARFPVVEYEAGSNGRHRVMFFDLRFGAVKGRKPFLYEVIFDADGEIVSQGFHRDYSGNGNK
jgi:inner membrane protein